MLELKVTWEGHYFCLFILQTKAAVSYAPSLCSSNKRCLPWDSQLLACCGFYNAFVYTRYVTVWCTHLSCPHSPHRSHTHHTHTPTEYTYIHTHTTHIPLHTRLHTYTTTHTPLHTQTANYYLKFFESSIHAVHRCGSKPVRTSRKCDWIKLQKAQPIPTFQIPGSLRDSFGFFPGPCVPSRSRPSFLWGSSPQGAGSRIWWNFSSSAPASLRGLCRATLPPAGRICKVIVKKLPNTTGCLRSSKHKSNYN